MLQLVPPPLLTAVDRILIVDTGETGRPGTYHGRIVRIRTPALDLRRGDPDYGNRFSLFTTTVLHEIGHAVYEELLTPQQRDLVLDDYISLLEASGLPTEGEPTDNRVQHHFVSILQAALLNDGRPPYRPTVARRSLELLGLELANS